MNASEFTKEIRFEPAFDRRHSDPNQNYGINGVDLWFFLKGPKGGVSFHVLTNWQLPHVQKETDARMLMRMDEGGLDVALRCFYHPLPAELAIHSPVPLREGQRPHGSTKLEWRDPTDEEKQSGFHSKVPVEVERDTYSECHLVDGGMCFVYGAYAIAGRVFEILLTDGSDGIWKRLEDEYRIRFEEEA